MNIVIKGKSIKSKKEKVYEDLEKFVEDNSFNICDVDLGYVQFERPEEWALQTLNDEGFRFADMLFADVNYENLKKYDDLTNIELKEFERGTIDRFHQHRLTFTEAHKIIDFVYKLLDDGSNTIKIGTFSIVLKKNIETSIKEKNVLNEIILKVYLLKSIVLQFNKKEIEEQSRFQRCYNWLSSWITKDKNITIINNTQKEKLLFIKDYIKREFIDKEEKLNFVNKTTFEEIQKKLTGDLNWKIEVLDRFLKELMKKIIELEDKLYPELKNLENTKMVKDYENGIEEYNERLKNKLIFLVDNYEKFKKINESQNEDVENSQQQNEAVTKLDQIFIWNPKGIKTEFNISSLKAIAYCLSNHFVKMFGEDGLVNSNKEILTFTNTSNLVDYDMNKLLLRKRVNRKYYEQVLERFENDLEKNAHHYCYIDKKKIQFESPEEWAIYKSNEIFIQNDGFRLANLEDFGINLENGNNVEKYDELTSENEESFNEMCKL
ncbi:hypothetical protein ACQ4LE_009584 [Meloidogyne hapla]|uniref:DNA-directed DNA polymerase n=1 Tax=Meloidogyne hapla TaxID=6305 RepID=A0A1I8BT84_MELHA